LGLFSIAPEGINSCVELTLCEGEMCIPSSEHQPEAAQSSQTLHGDKKGRKKVLGSILKVKSLVVFMLLSMNYISIHIQTSCI
jgi:hypothetical protein